MNKLKEVRESKNVSVVQIAKRVGVTRQAIYNYETGERTPYITQIIPLAKAYGMTIKELIECFEENEQGTN